jgi:hypothetical protein
MLYFALRLFCSHKETVLRVENDRLFTECIRCLHKSPGISTKKALSSVISRRVKTAVLNRTIWTGHGR